LVVGGKKLAGVWRGAGVASGALGPRSADAAGGSSSTRWRSQEQKAAMPMHPTMAAARRSENLMRMRILAVIPGRAQQKETWHKKLKKC